MTDQEVKEEIHEEVEEEVQEEETLGELMENSEEESQEEPQEELETEDEVEEQELSEEEQEKLKKQEAYRERQKQKRLEKKQEIQQTYDQPVQQATQNIDQDEMQEAIATLKQIKYQQEYNAKLNQAEKELKVLENDFREAFDDYDDVVNEALEFSKFRLMDQGLSEAEADERLRTEKILIADKAAAQGLDPVEAVYNEGKSIVSLLDRYMEKKGAVKVRPTTKLEAMRKISKPNAVTGGKGRGATVQSKNFDDLEDLEEIDNVTLGELM